MKEYPEKHQQGRISFEQDFKVGAKRGDLGIQIARSGKIWICVDGLALIRFVPEKGGWHENKGD